MTLLKEGKVEVITGELGGGKTAFAVELAFDHLLSGGTVYTNIEMFPEVVAKRMAEQGVVFDPERLIFLTGDTMRDFHSQIARGTEGWVVMVMIDEAHLDNNARDWATQSREFLNFITLCRKLDIYLCFITQDANDLDKQIRRRVTVETNCRNMKQEKLFGVIDFPLPLYVRVRFKVNSGRITRKLDHDWKFRCSAWGMYNSKALLGAHAKKFSEMGVVKTGRLQRVAVERPGLTASLAAAAIIVLCVMS